MLRGQEDKESKYPLNTEMAKSVEKLASYFGKMIKADVTVCVSA